MVDICMLIKLNMQCTYENMPTLFIQHKVHMHVSTAK